MSIQKTNGNFILPTFKNTTEIVKTNYFFNDFKQRSLVLSCSKIIIDIIS